MAMTTTTSMIDRAHPHPIVARLLDAARRVGMLGAGPRVARATFIPIGRAGTGRHA